MNSKLKCLLIAKILSLLIFSIIWKLLIYTPLISSNLYINITITALITFMLSPKITVVKVQMRANYQLKWLFLSKVFLIKKRSDI